jgi:predicted ArsR family transcriptional regulator
MTRNGSGRLEGTREQILNILRRSQGASVDDLALELGLAGATVRRHLDVLLRDDYISVTQVRGGTGRPRHIFSLTERGAELFPHHYVRITHRLLEEIVALTAEETTGRDGGELAELVVAKMCTRLLHEYGPRVVGDTIEARVESALALLEDEGLDFEVDRSHGELRLLGRGLCARIGHGSPGADGVDHDRALLEELLGVPVEALPPGEVPHEFLCAFRLVAPVSSDLGSANGPSNGTLAGASDRAALNGTGNGAANGTANGAARAVVPPIVDAARAPDYH